MRDGQDPLSQFLQLEAEAGTRDSQGVFTISGEAAIGKLAAFQLPRPSAWVLKIVQAAVAGRAPKVEFRQDARVTLILFQPRERFTVDDLQSALMTTNICENRSLEHLSVALRAAGFGESRPFTLALEGDGWQHLLGWDGKQLSRRSVEDPEAREFLIRLGVAYPRDEQGRTLGIRSGKAVAEYQELVNSANICPIPLKVDGRRLDTSVTPRGHSIHAYKTSLLCLGWGAQSDCPILPLPAALPEEDKSWRPTDRFTDKRPFRRAARSRGDQATMLYRVEYHYRIESYRGKHKSFTFHGVPLASSCRWVKDGVVVDEQRIDQLTTNAVNLVLYLSADGLGSDISGFKLRDSDVRSRRCAAAVHSILGEMEQLEKDLQSHKPMPFGWEAAAYGAIGVAALASLPTFGKSLMGAAMGYQMISSAHDKYQLVKDSANHLDVLTGRMRRVR